MLLNLDDSLQHAMHTVSDFVGESVPIIDRETRELLGIITEGDLFKVGHRCAINSQTSRTRLICLRDSLGVLPSVLGGMFLWIKAFHLIVVVT